MSSRDQRKCQKFVQWEWCDGTWHRTSAGTGAEHSCCGPGKNKVSEDFAIGSIHFIADDKSRQHWLSTATGRSDASKATTGRTASCAAVMQTLTALAAMKVLCEPRPG